MLVAATPPCYQKRSLTSLAPPRHTARIATAVRKIVALMLPAEGQVPFPNGKVGTPTFRLGGPPQP